MEWLTLILTILFGVLGIHYMFRRKINKLEKLGILHIKPLPLIGNFGPALFRRCHFTDVLTRIYKLDENAKYVGLYDFGEPVIMIRSPELIKNISVKNFDHFTDHRAFADPEVEPLFGKNLIGLRGEKWKEVRNLLSPAFTSSKMKAMFKLMANCGKNFVDCLVDISLKKSNIFDVKDAFTRYTNDVIATCAFGISIDSMKNPKNDFYVLGKDATNFDGFKGIKFFFARSFPTIAKYLNVKLFDPKVGLFFENVVRDTIETRDREGITRPDMIQLMMETRGREPSEGPQLTILEMTAQAFIFFFGGFESTATVMCFAAHEIAVNPDVQAKLRDEIDKVMIETNGDVTYEAVNGMQYLDAVINETLRLHPVVAFLDRLCVKSFELPPALPGGKSIIIEPGQNVWFPASCMHRDAKYFSQPDKFDPDRFTGSAKFDINPFTYFPFGQGPRMCIGNRFALLEIKVLIFYLLAKFYLKPSARMIMPLKLSKTNFAMMPEGGFWLELETRNTLVKK